MPANIDLSPTTKLPFGDTIGASFRMAFSKEAWSMPLIWVPIAVSLLAAGLIFQNGGYEPKDWTAFMAQLTHAKGSHASLSALPEFESGGILGLFLKFITQFIVVATGFSWLRYIVRGNKPSGIYMGIDYWMYYTYRILYIILVIIFLIALFLIVVSASLLLKTAVGSVAGISAIIIIIASYIFLIWISLRISLKFYGVALGDSSMTWRRSYQLMRGNVAVVLFGVIVSLLPTWIATGAIQLFIMVHGLDSIGEVVVLPGIGLGILVLLQILIYESFMGIAYKRLVPAPAAPAERMMPEGFA